MKKLIFLFLAIVVFLASCSSDNADANLTEANCRRVSAESTYGTNSFEDDIMPIDSDGAVMRKKVVATRASNSNSYLYEELNQLDQIPIYLQIKGNTSSKQFLNAKGEGYELSFENFKSNSLEQQFYIKILPASSGIPYMIFSKKTNTPISLGIYKNKPEVKIVYVKPKNNKSTFGASWDIYRGKYSTESFVIENEDYPRKGTSNEWYDIYYSVITANDNKVSLEKYSDDPRQEFSIIPAEDFRVESVTFDTKTSTLSNTPDVIFSDKFTNRGKLEQNHTFTIIDSYKKTSSFNRKTSYNVNVTTKIKIKVPFIANGEISTSVSGGQEFTYGENEEHTFSIDRSYPIVVPANYVAQMTLTLSKYSMDVEYCAKCVGLITGKRINIRGIWKGVDVQESDAVLELTPCDNQKNVKKKIVISKDMITNSKGYIRVN